MHSRSAVPSRRSWLGDIEEIRRMDGDGTNVGGGGSTVGQGGISSGDYGNMNNTDLGTIGKGSTPGTSLGDFFGAIRDSISSDFGKMGFESATLTTGGVSAGSNAAGGSIYGSSPVWVPPPHDGTQ